MGLGLNLHGSLSPMRTNPTKSYSCVSMISRINLLTTQEKNTPGYLLQPSGADAGVAG